MPEITRPFLLALKGPPGDTPTKEDLGLDAVDNTSDADKPISTATAAALAAKANASHGHSAADITSGTLDVARLPVLPGTNQVVSSGPIASLTTEQQAEIAQGTVVTTTDGQRWIYTGTGGKTLEASYILISDISPEWSAIANKPSTFAPQAHGHVPADITLPGAGVVGKTGGASTPGPGTTITLATAATGNSIPYRPAGGTLEVATPTAAAHATTKAYVDLLQATSYAKASLPAATPAGKIIYVTDATGGACIAFSNGTNWLRCDTSAVIS